MFVDQSRQDRDHAALIALVRAERQKALSLREWKHRLAGYGYALRDTDHGTVIASLSRDHEICALPHSLMS